MFSSGTLSVQRMATLGPLLKNRSAAKSPLPDFFWRILTTAMTSLLSLTSVILTFLNSKGAIPTMCFAPLYYEMDTYSVCFLKRISYIRTRFTTLNTNLPS